MKNPYCCGEGEEKIMLFFWLTCLPRLRKQWATCERFTECPSAREAKNALQDRELLPCHTDPQSRASSIPSEARAEQYRGGPAWCGRSGARSRGSTPAARPRARTPGTGNPRGGRCAAPWTPTPSPRTHPQRGWQRSCGTAAGSPGVWNLHPPAETFPVSEGTPLLLLSPLEGTCQHGAAGDQTHKVFQSRKCAL